MAPATFPAQRACEQTGEAVDGAECAGAGGRTGFHECRGNGFWVAGIR